LKLKGLTELSCRRRGPARSSIAARPGASHEGTDMKRLLMLTISATMLFTPVASRAQQIDLSVITCKQFFDYSKENMMVMMMWLDGYYSEEDAPPVVDFEKMGENMKKLGEYCSKNQGKSVITAADAVWEMSK
jgi:acid stress chaperone HdeB